MTDDGRAFVLKITNAAEDPVVTDFQIRALLHIAAQQADVRVPEVVPTLDGEHSFRLDTGQLPFHAGNLPVTVLKNRTAELIERARIVETSNFGGGS